jgi:DNA-binding response OmpR family regulator
MHPLTVQGGIVMNKHILIIDDDVVLLKILTERLSPQGFEVITASGGREGLRLAYNHNPDLVILDVMMPELDGYTICERLREMSDVPILMLTAITSEDDIVRCFQQGADDVVQKPFRMRELEARILAHIKRSGPDDWEKSTYDDGTLRIDLVKKQVYRMGEVVNLTPTEYRLLASLVSHRGSVVSHDDLLIEVWGKPYKSATVLLSVYINYLRKKLEDDPQKPRYIHTKWGSGYWFDLI